MNPKKLFITIFVIVGLLTVFYYLGYFLVSKDFLPELAKSAGSLIRFDNNVEIGSGKTLKVGGTIESTSGGFKFPDGNTQTMAAKGGKQLFTTSGTFTVPPE